MFFQNFLDSSKFSKLLRLIAQWFIVTGHFFSRSGKSADMHLHSNFFDHSESSVIAITKTSISFGNLAGFFRSVWVSLGSTTLDYMSSSCYLWPRITALGYPETQQHFTNDLLKRFARRHFYRVCYRADVVSNGHHRLVCSVGGI